MVAVPTAPGAEAEPDDAAGPNLRRAERRIRGGGDREVERVAVGLVVVEEHVDVDDVTADQLRVVVPRDRRTIERLEHREGHASPIARSPSSSEIW